MDNAARVISHSNFREYGKHYTDPFLTRAQESGQVLVRPHRGESEGDALEFAAPLSIEGKRWGILLFSLSLADVEEEIRAMISQIIQHSILALSLLFLLIYLLSRRFIKPIIDLSQAMGEVEVEMSEKVIPVKGNDELALLTRSFNEMVRRIRNANEEMKLAHEKLLQSEKLATLGVLSSSIAHRVNNPLGGLFNCVGLLRKKGEDREFRASYLDLIDDRNFCEDDTSRFRQCVLRGFRASNRRWVSFCGQPVGKRQRRNDLTYKLCWPAYSVISIIGSKSRESITSRMWTMISSYRSHRMIWKNSCSIS